MVHALMLAYAIVAPAHARCDANSDLLPFVPAAGWPNGWQGFVRIDNSLENAATIPFVVSDDAGNSHTQSVAIGPGQTLHFNSEDLQWGNAGKGVSGVLEEPVGSWRLCFQDLPLGAAVSAYLRTEDGFLTDMTMTVEASYRCKIQCPEWRIPIFNPAKNIDQVSLLRLINNSSAPVPVVIQGVKSDGATNRHTDGTIQLAAGYIGADKAVEITANQLESGIGIGLEACNPEDASDCLESVGAIGPANGKWALYLSRLDQGESDELVVMNMLRSPTGHVTSLPAGAQDTWLRR